jgi:glycosyltransferase involved in cell wall biosynthesis
MAITFAIHEATRTGAPRVGALIARELARGEEVRVVVMKDGPLTPWLQETLGGRDLMICRGEPFDHRRPFEERLRLAEQILGRHATDVVYVNSLASSVFAFAGAALKRKVVLHVHEKSADMVSLLAHDVTKLEVMRAADALVLAADDIARDIAEVFHAAPAEMTTFGVAVEIEHVRRAAQEAAASPVNARGEALAPGQRMIVGMCGHASYRKGADIFLETAAAVPEADFLWVGGWRPQEAGDNIAYAGFNLRALPNLYVAGAVDNPYPYMAIMDLFFLSSREDPNPLVVGEALALGVPILAFSATTAIADRLGRCGVLCYGKPNAVDAARILRASNAETLRRPGFRSAGEAFVADYDLRAKMADITGLIARQRGDSAPPVMPGAAQRRLEGGAVELSFS